MAIPAVVAAGDQGAAKAVYGESKVFLEVGGRSLVAHVVLALQQVAEVSEVWVVGDAARLQAELGRAAVASGLRKPLHLIGQFRDLYENAWESYRRLLPGAGAEGRDPGPDDLDRAVLYLSGDLPFATPAEIGEFVRRASALDCDYALGLVTEESMRGFWPSAPGEPGIHMASFNLREGRFRQSNLHLVRPARLGNRHYIEDMYRHRHQRELGSILGLAWRLLTTERGGLRMVYWYLLMHAAGLCDRWGWRGAADVIRRWIPLARVERACGDLLRTRFRFVVTEVGGCAVDIDTEEDCDAARLRFEEWSKAQQQRAAQLASHALPSGSEQQSGAEP
jgi:hypothetical protein